MGGCQEAFACSCTGPDPPAEAFEKSKTVFSGQVIGINSTESGKLVTFHVDRAWKGVSNNTITASTPFNSAACGYEFEQGKEYLVYSNSDVVALVVYLCSRTQPLDEAASDLAILGEGYQLAQEDEILTVLSISPKLSDVDGNALDGMLVPGTQIILSAILSKSVDHNRSSVVFFEIIDSNDVAVYLAWQIIEIPADGAAEVGVSWLSCKAGNYELKVIHVLSLVNPGKIYGAGTGNFTISEL